MWSRRVSSLFTLRIIGADRVAAGLTRIQDATEPQRTVVRRLGDRYVTVLKEETPKGRGEHAGAARAGYEDEQDYTATRASYRIRNRVAHLRHIIRGRGRVVAKRGKALRFVIDGQVFFRRSVGPAKANNFPPRARAKMRGEIEAARRELPRLIVRQYRGRS
jgi:hypothetical protein